MNNQNDTGAVGNDNLLDASAPATEANGAQDGGQGGEQQDASGEGQAGGEGQAAAAAQAPANVLKLDPESLAAIGRAAQPPLQQQQPQISPEEADRLLAVHKFTQEDLADALGLQPEQVEKAYKFMTALTQGVVRQAVTAAGLQLRMFEQQHVMPLNQFRQSMEDQRHEAAFFEKFADLKPYAQAARLVYQGMIRAGAKFATPDEAYAAIAQQTRQVLNLQGQNGAQQQPGQGRPSGGNLPRMSTVTTGGRGMAGGNKSQVSESVRGANELFED